MIYQACSPSRKRWKVLLTFVVPILLAGLLFGTNAVRGAPAATFTVNNIGDGGDANPGDGVCETAASNGICTLRAAIEETNALTGADTIYFDGSISIMPQSPLPALNDASGGTTIRGNPNWILGIFLETVANGLALVSDNNKLQGLYITNFKGAGVRVVGDNNIIGVDGDGVDDDDEGNVISTNGEYGVVIRDDATGTWLAGNLIGTFDGTEDDGNGKSGVAIYYGAHTNLIGTNGDGVSDDLERNVISGNDEIGVVIAGDDVNQNTVAGNYIGTNAAGDAAIPNTWSGVWILGDSANNLIGTDGDGLSDELERNVISGNESAGIRLDTSSGSVVAGNYIGTNAAGDAAIPNGSNGVLIQGSSTNNLIGTDADGASDELERNVISGNNSQGVYIYTEGTEGNVVAGNYIGTNASGDAAIPNGGRGVQIQTCANNRVGGTVAAERNVISGNTYDGVMLYMTATVNLVQGNYIGTDASGNDNLGNGHYGVNLSSGVINNTVGGAASGAGNRIAFNGKAGIRVAEYTPRKWFSYDNSLRGNAIFSNSELGIDLWLEEGITPNDTGDGDTGANNLQNFPVLSSAASDGAQITIEGLLNSASSTSFELDFYANSSCDPSGYGEGESYLGADTVATDGSGNASFTTILSGLVPQGYFVTATATDPDGNTSEFSLCQLVVAACDPVEVVTTTTDISGCVVDFAAELTGDPPFTYAWDFDAFGGSDAPAPTVDFLGDGAYSYALTALNCGGVYSDTYAGEVTVACGVCTPVTNTLFTWDPLTPTAGAEITFDGMAQGSTPITFTWDFDDGGTATGATVKHTYAVTGTHVVTLTTENGCGTDEAVRTVVVGEVSTKDYFIYLPLVLRN